MHACHNLESPHCQKDKGRSYSLPEEQYAKTISLEALDENAAEIQADGALQEEVTDEVDHS